MSRNVELRIEKSLARARVKRDKIVKDRYKIWLVIEDLQTETDVEDVDALAGIAYRDTLEDAIEAVQQFGRQITEIV